MKFTDGSEPTADLLHVPVGNGWLVERAVGRNGHNRRGRRVHHDAAVVAPHHSAAASVRSDDCARRIGRPSSSFADRELLARPAPVTSRAEWIEHVGLVRRRDGSLLFGCPEALPVECSLKNTRLASNCFNCSLTCCCGRKRGAWDCSCCWAYCWTLE